ncbi:MAG: carbon storage regulator [Planctomycetes bacterium]|nr:carbon storage regulator [Planctomycetota bacterium]
MLVLSRTCGQGIVVRDEITINVLAIQGNRVRLGITAPAAVRVQREELAVRSDRLQAVSAGAMSLASLRTGS